MIEEVELKYEIYLIKQAILKKMEKNYLLEKQLVIFHLFAVKIHIHFHIEFTQMNLQVKIHSHQLNILYIK